MLEMLLEYQARAVVAISDPIVSKAWKNNDLKLIKDIYYKSSINQLIIGGIFCFVFGFGR